MLTKDEIMQLLNSTETARVERTVSTGDMDKFQEAICAFSNDLSDSRKNGYLIIGAHDDGRLSGLRVNDNLYKKISGIRSDGNILPLPVMNCELYHFDDGDLLVVEVQPSFTTPVRYRGRTFVRIGPRRDIATIDEERILSEKNTANMATFDASPCYKATLDDIMVDAIINDYLPSAVDATALVDDDRDVKHRLAAVGLYDVEHDRPTYASLILFGRNPRQFMPGFAINYVCFDGEDRSADITDERIFTQCLYSLLPEAEAFINYGIVRQIPTAVSTLREESRINYPKEALRELLLNSVMHRDYQSTMPTRLYNYKTHVELMNPGGLYGKARPENFPDVNDYRNPIVAQALKVMGYVNMYNRGVSRVKRMFCENGNPEPQFKVDKITVFEVICPIVKGAIVDGDKMDGATHKTIQKEDSTIQKNQIAVQNTIQKLSEQQKAILEYLSNNPNATREELKNKLGDASLGGIIHNLSRLQELGLLKRVGGRKTGHWEVIE